MSDVTIRRPREDEYDEIIAASSVPFSFDPDETFEPLKAMFPTDRMLIGDDRGQIVGTSAAHAYRVTIPGGSNVGAAGISFVTVLPTHRRRGVMRAMMQGLFEDAADASEPLALLWATEGGIYGRFGFGPAVETVRQRIDSSRTTLVAADQPLGAVRIVDRDEAVRVFATIHAEVAGLRHGTLHRSDPFAEYYLHDYSWEKEGHTKPRFALYEGDDGKGYVVFRTKSESPGTVRFEEMFVTSLAARRALLAFGLGFDMRRDLVLWGRPGDDPVRWMLTNPYAMKTEDWDYVWYRLVDLKAALEARRYETDGSIVLEVIDEQLDHNNGTWKVEITAGVASVERTAATPDLTMPTDVLAALYMGGRRLSGISEAGVIVGDASKLALLDRLFRTTTVPWTAEEF
ncbi:MAG: GNAT family N-acetyltransferase [Acidobacteria bacterium]|nr:GNAT family N-acetyltransferase [Acidobacteriota bacterium]